jgi:bifunctional non-homologous end joining protein LigD
MKPAAGGYLIVPEAISKKKTYSRSKSREGSLPSKFALVSADGAKKSCIPAGIMPMSFKLTPEAFNHKDWQFEIKWDGFRALAYLDKRKVRLRSRNNMSLDKRFYPVKEELEGFGLNAVLDGEIVLLNEKDCADFGGLMNGRKGCLVYYVFDMPWYNGYNLMGVPLYKRREILKSILPKSDVIRFSKHVDEDGIELFNEVKSLQLEGIVAKNKYSLYYPGERTNKWLKIKTEVVREAVVAGILLDRDKRGSGFNSLIVGVEEGGAYRYLGLVNTGITRTTLNEILSSARATTSCIFSPVPPVNARVPFREPIKNAEVIWLEPQIRCMVKYLELDEYGLMRHARFGAIVEG